MPQQSGDEKGIDGLGEGRGMTNISAVKKMAELMQQMEENSPRVAALQYCLSEVAKRITDLEQKLAESQREFRAADATIENLQMQVEKLAAENAGMNAFVDALLSIAWQGGSADGAEIQEMALKHGLLRQEVYSADEHETLVDDPGNFEDGDQVYFRIKTQATDDYMRERGE